MSTEINVIRKSGSKGAQLQVTKFAGPADRGPMLQLTQGLGTAPDEPGFIQLTRQDAEELISILLSWLNSSDSPEADFWHWFRTYWRFGSSTDLVRARRAYEAAKSEPSEQLPDR
jgi:hypothetical protein